MTLSIEERVAIVNYRIAKANETLIEIVHIIPLGYWNNIANRLYYSAYYVVSALLIQNNYIANTHSGVKNLFSLYFVKTGIISKDLMRLYSKLFDLRLKGDYDDFFDLEESDILPLIDPVKEFVQIIKNQINV